MPGYADGDGLVFAGYPGWRLVAGRRHPRNRFDTWRRDACALTRRQVSEIACQLLVRRSDQYQPAIGRALLDREDPGDCIGVERIAAQPVNAFRWIGDQPTLKNDLHRSLYKTRLG